MEQAYTCFSGGQYDLAEAATLDVLQQRQKELGIGHADTLECMFFLATTQDAQGNADKSSETLTKLLELAEEHLGDTHSVTISASSAYAVVCQKKGRIGEAKDHATRALERRKLAGTENDADANWIKETLARSCLALGEYAEAADASLALLEQEQSAATVSSTRVIAATRLLAEARRKQGRIDDAEGHYLAALEKRQQLFDEENGSPTPLLEMMDEVAGFYFEQQRFEDDEKISRRALALCEAAYGEENTITIDKLESLMQTYRAWGKEAEEQESLTRLVKLKTATYGKTSPEALTVMYELSLSLFENGSIKKAADLMREVESLSRDHLGPEHEVTQDATKTLEEWSAASETIAGFRNWLLDPDHLVGMEFVKNSK